MRIVSLNVNHRTRPSPIPSGLALSIGDLEPDVVVLTEYVKGPDHEPFTNQMHEMGFRHSAISQHVEYKRGAWQNQVFILSRRPLVDVRLHRDAPEPQANTNILTVTVGAIRLVGLRAPSYKGRQWLDFWHWIGEAAQGDVAIGDFNVDPGRGRARDKVLDGFLAKGDWNLVHAAGEWSYEGPTGRRSCIDHCVVAPRHRVEAAFYQHEPFIGNMTDHAALVVDLGRQ